MPNLYLIGFVAVIAAALAGDYLWTKKQNEQLKLENAQQVEVIESQRARIEAKAIVDEANRRAAAILNNSQVENAVAKERRVARASAEQITETAKRDAEKYTGFTERVMEKNFEILQCKSDYRKIHDEENPCIGHVR